MNKKKECIESQVAESFKKSFYRKFGYFPLIILEKPSNRRPSLIMPLDELEEHFKVFINKNPECKGYDLKTKHRYRALVDYRFMFTHIARSMEYKLTTIGQYLNKHHSSIIHYEYTFSNMMETSDCFKEKYEEIFNYIKNKIKRYDKLPVLADTDEEWNKS